MQSTTETSNGAEPQKLNAEALKQKAADIFADLRRYATEHRELSRKNFDEFRAKHKGVVADVKTSVQKAIPKEEVQARVREVNDLVEKRLETIRSDVEKRYDELEREIQETVERVFGHKVAAGAPEPAPSAAPETEVPASVASPAAAEPTTETPSSTKKRRAPNANN